MQLLSLRSAGRDDETAEAIGRRFLLALFGGRFDEAARLARSDFTWFGQTSVDWEGRGIRAFVEIETEISNVRVVEPQMVELLHPTDRTRIFGGLGEDDRVVLADATRQGRCSTAALVVDVRKRRVTRVLDAMPFREALEALVEQASG